MTFERIGMNHKELLCPTVNSYSFQLQSPFQFTGQGNRLCGFREILQCDVCKDRHESQRVAVPNGQQLLVPIAITEGAVA